MKMMKIFTFFYKKKSNFRLGFLYKRDFIIINRFQLLFKRWKHNNIFNPCCLDNDLKGTLVNRTITAIRISFELFFVHWNYFFCSVKQFFLSNLTISCPFELFFSHLNYFYVHNFIWTIFLSIWTIFCTFWWNVVSIILKNLFLIKYVTKKIVNHIFAIKLKFN